ncbi:hypothetical protein ACH5RR_011869 [Cinchona calisaya]|uniref:Uncharacterized protein n=1 Tax=Cinchona calisaya TaxID=153742 RepID=A0ABD3A7Q3_9GENT
MVIREGASLYCHVVGATETTQPLKMPLQSLTTAAPNFTATTNQYHAVAPTVPLSVALHLIVDDVAIHFWGRIEGVTSDSVKCDKLDSLMDYAPTIPDELVPHYLAKSAFRCPDVGLIM